MVWAVLIIVLGTAASLGLLLVVRRYWGRETGAFHDLPAASAIYGVLGSGYAILLAFVIVSTFTSYHDARNDAGTEAVAVRELSGTAGFFIPTARDALRGDLVCYGRSVVGDEWPAMQRGTISTTTEYWVTTMQSTVQDMPVTTTKESVALGAWLDESENRMEARRGRLAEGAAFVPDFLWGILVALLVLVIGFQCLFGDPRANALGQLIGVGAVAATLVAGLTLIWMLDRPFNDRGAQVHPTQMVAAVQALERSDGADRLPLPCDQKGVPTR